MLLDAALATIAADDVSALARRTKKIPRASAAIIRRKLILIGREADIIHHVDERIGCRYAMYDRACYSMPPLSLSRRMMYQHLHGVLKKYPEHLLQ